MPLRSAMAASSATQVPVGGSCRLTLIVASASSTYAWTQTYPSGSRAERAWRPGVTRYLDAAVEQLRALPAEAREHDVLNEDVARLSPLKHANST